MRISTKTGDGGKTSLYSGERVPKTSPRIELVGILDELNAQLGFTQEEAVQRQLLELGALVANLNATGSMTEALTQLEAEIDSMEAHLPTLTEFILPGGETEAVHLHVARTICRRAERQLSSLFNPPKDSLPYLNRLSDYLFQKARFINFLAKKQERKWKP